MATGSHSDYLTQKLLESEAKIINTLRSLCEGGESGKIEINIVSGGVAGIFATITKRVK
jgi:hypothetical protein